MEKIDQSSSITFNIDTILKELTLSNLINTNSTMMDST